MAFETKNFFNSTIKQVYQQTGAVLSLETRSDRQVLINSLKLFEATFVYNWQKVLYPILKGPEGSPYQTYSGMRSKPWAEYDSLDSVFGGIHGWTLTAEPWATEDSLPALWDEVNKQPHSITGALYYLSERIESLSFDESMFQVPEFDDSELRNDIDCLEKNLTTIFKDVYGCAYQMDCDGNRDQEYSLYTHIYQIFDQLIDGGPVISVDDTCENNYPAMSIYMPTSALTYDVKIPSTEVSGYCSGSVYTELRAISTYTGMNCDLNPIYSQFGSLTHISDGSTFLKSIYDLDNALSNFSSTKTLQEAYDDGWLDSSNLNPGQITIINNSNKPNAKEGIKIRHPYTPPSRGGVVIPGSNAGEVIDSPLLSIQDEALSGSNYTFDFTGSLDSPDSDRWFSHLEVGEHEVGRNAQIALPNPAKYGDFIYPNIHIYRSVLNQMPTSGIPRTRATINNYQTYSAHDLNETAIWVASGYDRNGMSYSDPTYPMGGRPYDCDGNLVSADNLYYRQPGDGTIFKLNKCGMSIQTTSGGSTFEWGTDAPLGAAAFHGIDEEGSNGYFSSDILFVNPDENGVTVGWGGSSDLSSQEGAVTSDTFTIQEHYQGNLAKASLNLRSVNTGSKEEIVFSHGAYGSNTELASIATSVSDDFTFSTNDDNKDIVFKPYNIENLRLYTSGLAKFSGNLWVAGSLLVDGETTYINSSTLQVDDKNIELGTVDTPTDITADGGGITLKAASDKTITWSSSDNTWNSNVGFRSEGGFYLAENTSILLDSAQGYNGLASASKPFDESFVINSYVESLKFGNAAGDEGKIRYQSNDFEGHNGTSWVSLTASGGIDLTDLSVSTAAASGSGSLSYNNTNGTFTFTPPDLSGLGGSDNLGNHIATQNLNMSNYQINNTYKLNMVQSSGQHPEINSPSALDFNSQTASATSVCDYNFGAQTNRPASLNIATGSGGFVNIQAKSGSSAQQILHLPGTLATAGQILKVNSVNGTGQTYLEWSNECCDGAVAGLSAVVEDTAPELGGSLNAASNSILNVDYIGFDTTSDHVVGAGEIAWNSDEETFDMGLGGSTLQVGQESHIHVRNNTASEIPNGTAVMAAGSLGSSGRILVERMDASSSGDPSKFLGITTEAIPAGADGKITTFGKVRHLNTVGDVWSDGTSRGAASEVWSDGTVLWLNPGVPGELTALQPEAPNLKIAAAYIIHSATNGTIMVRANSGIDLHNNHRVQVSNLQAGDFLFWNSVRQRWENTSFNTSGSVIKVANDPNSGEPTFSLDEAEIFLTANNVDGLSTIATTGSYSDLTGTPNLSTVAITGNYADITGTPSIPTSTSELTNDSGFVDQEVTITGGGATTVTGSFPNFTITSTDTNTNTWRTVQVNGSSIGAYETLNIVAGDNVTLTESGGTITVNATVPAASSANNHSEAVDLTSSAFETSFANFYDNSEYIVFSTNEGSHPNDFNLMTLGKFEEVFAPGSKITIKNTKSNVAHTLTINSLNAKTSALNSVFCLVNSSGVQTATSSVTVSGGKTISFTVDPNGKLLYS